MKKEKILASLILSVSILVASQSVQAAEGDTYTKKTGSANVEIKAGTDEITPEPPEPTPPTGPYVPVKELGITSATDLYFDAISLSSERTQREALYLTKLGTPISNLEDEEGLIPSIDLNETYVPGFSVTDRRGNGAGWNLTLQLGEFSQTNVAEGGTIHTLKGASISFPKVEAITVASANPTIEEFPTTLEKTFSAGGQASTLMVAELGQGRGLWEARYNSRELELSNGTTATKAPIVLSVPGDNYAGTYQANLTWNLSDTPLATEAE